MVISAPVVLTPFHEGKRPKLSTILRRRENAAADRMEKRLSESIDPEVKEKINRHLAQTREQQDRLKLTIRALGGEPLIENGSEKEQK
jgi:hypothetical protein